MTLPCNEFLRRYLQHVLPRGFHKVRYYGLLSTSWRPKYMVLQSKLQKKEAEESIACVIG